MKKKSFEKFLKKHKTFKSKDLAEYLKISRQAAHKKIALLVEKGRLTKEGSTRSSVYCHANPIGSKKNKINFSRYFNILGLEEDLVFSKISSEHRLKENLSKKAYQIVSYVFTEILNNAIDHSSSKRVLVELAINNGVVKTVIEDKGVGVFNKVKKHFELPSAHAAAEHLLKGKQTTDEKKHSGQGIFFSSKSVDSFSIEDPNCRLLIDNKVKNVSFQESKVRKGTKVVFEIKKGSTRSLENIFRKYSNDEFEFDRTEIILKLSQFEELMSRSQAKRICLGLERFQRITLDFKGVDSVGQGFLDQILRVFQNENKNIKIESIHANRSINFMIKRTRARH